MGNSWSHDCDCASYEPATIYAASKLNDSLASLDLDMIDPNPDVAGVGVVVVAVLTSIATVLCSLALLAFKGHHLFTKDDEQIRKHVEDNLVTAKAGFESLLLTFSDQQLVIVMATTISALIPNVWCDLSSYHVNILCYLAAMAFITHLSSLVVQSHYFRYKLLGLFRSALIISNVALTGYLANVRSAKYFPTKSGQALQAVPATCLLHDNSTVFDQKDLGNLTEQDRTALIQFAVLCVCLLLSFAVAIVHSRHIVNKGRHIGLQKVSFVCCVAVVVACTIILGIILQKLFELRTWMIYDAHLIDNAAEENELGFGQVTPIILVVVTSVYTASTAISDRLNGRQLDKPATRPQGWSENGYSKA
jgi:uncharacterized membrane protein YidH (DUF202 family)